MSLLIQNCTLRGREGLWDVYCEGKSIAAIGQGLDRKADTTIDAKGNLLVPAFIDPIFTLIRSTSSTPYART